MSRKVFVQVSVLVLFLMASFGVTGNAQAGGVCGGTYIVSQGETLNSIAATCGTTVSAITAANPGISGTLHAGQAIMVPGITYIAPTYVAPTITPISPPININNGSYLYYNYYNNNFPPGYNGNYNGMYIVQPGDTFSGIADRLGVNPYDLWAANPQIWDINFIYPGQLVYVPINNGQLTNPSTATTIVVAVAPTPVGQPDLSYGTAPAGTPKGKIKLSNKSHTGVYVSLQITTNDGLNIINEYTVDGTFTVKEPAGWVSYVTSVGGQVFTGEFGLSTDPNRSITFYSNKVEVQ